MKTIIQHHPISYDPSAYLKATKENYLFLDIETTGLSSKTHQIYLIGLAYIKNNTWIIEQYFAKNLEAEKMILEAFLEKCKSFSEFITFNGSQFDIPFIKQRCKLYGLDLTFVQYSHLDLYKIIKSHQKFLTLPKCNQSTVEQYLGLFRNDVFTGKELITQFHKYQREESQQIFDNLLLHNYEDMLGMMHILPVCVLNQIFSQKVQNLVFDVSISTNNELTLFIKASYPFHIPFQVQKTILNGIIKLSNHTLLIHQSYTLEDKNYYFPNPKEYDFLISENHIIHKSLSTFVPKENKRKAKPEECYITTTDYFFEVSKDFVATFPEFKVYRNTYKASSFYFAYKDIISKTENKFFSKYFHYILQKAKKNS